MINHALKDSMEKFGLTISFRDQKTIETFVNNNPVYTVNDVRNLNLKDLDKDEDFTEIVAKFKIAMLDSNPESVKELNSEIVSDALKDTLTSFRDMELVNENKELKAAIMVLLSKIKNIKDEEAVTKLWCELAPQVGVSPEVVQIFSDLQDAMATLYVELELN